MTKKEAEIKLNLKIEKQKNAFCPLCNGPCNINCVSYKPPELASDSEGENLVWFVMGGYCNAYCLHGPD